MSTSPFPSENKASGNSEPPLSSFLDVRIPAPEVYPERPVKVVSVLSNHYSFMRIQRFSTAICARLLGFR